MYGLVFINQQAIARTNDEEGLWQRVGVINIDIAVL